MLTQINLKGLLKIINGLKCFFQNTCHLHSSSSVGPRLNIWAYLHLVVENLWHMCTGRHCINSNISSPSWFSLWNGPLHFPHEWFSYHPGPLSPAPGAELKSIKHPNILLNMDGLCHVAAPCNASWVIMVITQSSEARPEAPGWRGQTGEPETTGGMVAEEAGHRGQGEAGGALTSLSHKPSLSHQRPLDVCGHSLWSVLLNNQDADEGWWQVFELLGHLCSLDWKTAGRVVGRKVKMCLCLDCRLLKLEILHHETFYCKSKYWCGSWKQIGQSTVLFIFSLYWDGQKIESGSGQNVQAESDPLWEHVVSETEVYSITLRN